ncbi:hypothetical protein [Thalassococcus sp. S3]|uniref:hypothetical protein n=1 Tax=Thalassococcus sp. S3 TaxID=2017482 RepID=UPI00102446F2|nr:hypothetical protein [Thalassococcus sp. S3]QBF32552.1 hypothetical protein CFI11_15195 [Thalassococcus sp. S3]
MQVIFHCGAHFTDDDRLIRCLLRNKASFSQKAIAVPGPGKYRELLRRTLGAMQNADADPNARDVLMDAILDEESADRLILSNANFFGVPKYAYRDGLFYPAAPDRIASLNQLFPEDRIEIFFAIRNPVTFLPQLLESTEASDIETLLDGVDLRDVRWSDMLAATQAAAPNVGITVWCNEDTPLIWAEIIRAVAGLAPGEKIIGGFDLLHDLMQPEGMRRFRNYLREHPIMTEAQKRRVIAAFLGKFARMDVLEEELDIPGWTEAFVDEVTEAYDADMAEIRAIPGLRVIAP